MAYMKRNRAATEPEPEEESQVVERPIMSDRQRREGADSRFGRGWRTKAKTSDDRRVGYEEDQGPFTRGQYRRDVTGGCTVWDRYIIERRTNSTSDGRRAAIGTP